MKMFDYNKVVSEMTNDYEAPNQKKEMQRLVQKWNRTGLLEGLEVQKSSLMARLLENQAVELRSKMNEATQAGDIANFNKIAFPLVRRAFGQLLAQDIVSVQPMSLPSGLLFYLDYKYDRTKVGGTNGGSVYGQLDNAPPNNNSQLQGVGAQAASGGFYNMDSGYSQRNFRLSTAAPTYSGVTATSWVLGGVTVSAYNFTLADSAATDLANLHNIRVAASGELNIDGDQRTFRGLDAIHSLTGSAFAGAVDPTLTTLSGSVIQIFSTAAGAKTGIGRLGPDLNWTDGSVTAAVIIGPARTSVSVDNGTNNLGDFESVSAIPEINLSVSSVAVTAQTRKLKATWTPELAQDLAAYHALDADVELTSILSEVITTEIDRDILGQLLNGASVKAAWSRSIGRYVSLVDGRVVNTLNPTNSYSSTQAFYGTQQDWYQTLGETINTVSNEIHKRNLRSGANFIVTSPEISSIIESINTFGSTAGGANDTQYSAGVQKVGTLNNQFTIYKDPYFPPDRILVGYKGSGFLDSGFVYAPYVPLVVTPTIFEPNTFTPRKGVMHRAATQMVRPEYYGRITVTDLNVIGIG